MEHIQFKSLSSWFGCSCTYYKLWRYPWNVDWIFSTSKKHTHTLTTQINASLVFLHAFNSLVCWCWFTFTFGTLFILLFVVVIFFWISHWFCSMPFHVHTNDSVVLIVLLSMSQRTPNPNARRIPFFLSKNIGSPTITGVLMLVLVLQALDCSNISLTRAAFISQLFDHFEFP